MQQNIQENTTISGDLNTRTERFYRLCHLGLVWRKASPRQLLPGSQAGSVWIGPWESCLGQAASPGVRFCSPAVGWTCLAQADSPGHQPNKPEGHVWMAPWETWARHRIQGRIQTCPKLMAWINYLAQATPFPGCHPTKSLVLVFQFAGTVLQTATEEPPNSSAQSP